MKALTIEEINQLKADDRIWLINDDTQTKEYVKVDMVTDWRYKDLKLRVIYFITNVGVIGLSDYDYGKTWLAYRNKEEADRKEVL